MYSSTLFFELSLSASSRSALAIIVSEVVAACMEMERVIENELAIVRYDDLKKIHLKLIKGELALNP